MKRDDALALSWFKKAAMQGLASAQMNAALMTARGREPPRISARPWSGSKRRPKQDEEEAQVNLAQMYSLGEGTTKDLIESYKWFSIALKHPGLDARSPSCAMTWSGWRSA